MNKVWVLFLVGLALTSVRAHAGHDHDDEDDGDNASEVVALDASTFDDHIAARDLTLVEFYAPWCGHCKALAPEYDRASIMLQATPGVLAKVDCTEHRDLCSRYGVQGFPTLKLFRNDGGEPGEYDQARKAEAIVKFINKQRAPAYRNIATAAELEAFKQDKVAAVAFLAADDADRLAAFVTAAKALRNDYEFAVASSEELLATVSAPAIVLYKNFDEPEVRFAGEYSGEDIVQFVRSNAFPLVGTIGPENYQKYLERGYPLVWIFIDIEKDKAVVSAAEAVAKDFKTSLSFVKLDGHRWADHAKTFGLNGEPPGIVIEDRENRKNYVFPQSAPVTVDALRAHAQGFLDKSLAPTVKSEEPPKDNNGPVKVVVGKTFDSIVFDATKDVLVEFYAPWCGHCKSLAPKYEKLGELFSTSPSVVIAKIDATENDTPIDIKGFPTLIFFPANNKENPITYDGDRTEAAMASFIRENASTLKKDGESADGKDEL